MYQYDIWYMPLCVHDLLVCRSGWKSRPAYQKAIYTVTYTRCRIDTINSPDDGHVTVRNVYGIEINVHEKELCVKLVIYKDRPPESFMSPLASGRA